ncbi:MAG: DUF5320 domain-containing protein [Nanoarchaeota archaeon]
MPIRDGTGPSGQGPMTGRGLGPCGAGLRQGFVQGRGIGRGRGLALGCCPVANQVALTSEEEKKILEAELKELDLDKVEIQKRLKALKS